MPREFSRRLLPRGLETKCRKISRKRNLFSIACSGDPRTSGYDDASDGEEVGFVFTVPVNTNKNGKPAVMAGGKHDAYTYGRGCFKLIFRKCLSIYHLSLSCRANTRTRVLYHDSLSPSSLDVKRYPLPFLPSIFYLSFSFSKSLFPVLFYFVLFILFGSSLHFFFVLLSFLLSILFPSSSRFPISLIFSVFLPFFLSCLFLSYGLFSLG